MKEGWVKKSISEICNKASSNIAQNKIADIDGDYPVYGASGYVQNVDFYHRDTPYIGIVKDGSGVGRVNIYPAYSSLLGTMQYIIPKEGYQLGYVAYALKGLNLSSFASGAAIPHIYFKNYGKCKIDVPPLAEQERIVAELDLLSGIIEKKKEQLKAYDQLAQSIFYTMFGDPVTNEKGWDIKKLGDIGKIITGNTPSTRDERNYDSDDVCFFKPSDIAKDGISLLGESEFHVSSFAYNNSRKLPKGSVLVTCIGIVGKVGILEIDAMCNQQINAIIPNEDVTSVYVAYSVLSERKIIESIAHAPVVPIINKGEFSQLCIPLPPLHLQQEFAEKVEAIERQKALVQQSIDETQTMFDYTMDKYFG